MKQHNEGFVALVKEVKHHITETDVSAVKHKMERKEPFYLIDVREQDEWNKGHLPNAIHISKGTIERDIEKIIPDKNADIILYCGGGFRSALATYNIQKMGYRNVISMDGGFKEWLNAKFPVVVD